MPGMVVRAGYGIYYDQSSLAPGEGLYFSPPYFNFNVYYPLGPTAPLLLNNPFPSNFPLPTPSSALAFQRDLRTPYIQQWNFNIQRTLGRNRMAEAGYVGSKGTRLIVTYGDLNRPIAVVDPRTPGLASLRSSSILGLSIITANFDPSSDVFRDRQVVSERLASAAGRLPRQAEAPSLTPFGANARGTSGPRTRRRSVARCDGLAGSTRP